MRFKIQKTKEYERVISACYETDPELIEKFHALAPTTKQLAVQHTVRTFKGIESLVMYEIVKDGETIAYFGKETVYDRPDFLCGFFIIPEYRTREFVIKFWKILKSKYKSIIFCSIYNKNVRALRFLKKKGFIFVVEVFVPHENQYGRVYKL